MDLSGMNFRRISIEIRDPVVIVRLLDFDPYDVDAVLEIGAEFRRLAESGATAVVVDFGPIQYFEANLRGMLVMLRRWLLLNGGRLAICSPHRNVRELLVSIHFDKLMHIVPTVEAAIAAFGSTDHSHKAWDDNE